MTGPDLKPCPFCGRPAEIVEKETWGERLYFVGCHIDQRDVCIAVSSGFGARPFDSVRDAAAAWNRRAETKGETK